MTDEEDPTFVVDVEEATTPVTAGGTVTVTVVVENTGDGGEEAVSLLDTDDEELTSEDVELESGESDTVDLEWETANDDVGDHDCTVDTDDDSDAVSVTVDDAPAAFDVEIASAPEHIASGQQITVSVTVENTGTLEGTQDIEFVVDGDLQETVSDVTLAGMASDSFEFTYETTETDDAPDINVEVSSEDATASQTVPVVTTSVSPLREMGSQGGMGIFGWLMFLGMVIILIPLLPFLVLIRLINIIFGDDRPVR